MKFLIITHVNHIQHKNGYFGYAPYIREMNVWVKYVDQLIILAPIKREIPTEIEASYEHKSINFRKVSDVSFTTFRNTLISVFKLPVIFLKIFFAMKEADHIHLRCPGNMGLIGCCVQIFFPGKIKTAKYAGNWDNKSKQPLSYNIQKFILRNRFLTRNMKVLVYGDWKTQSKNIKSFFTATYSDSEKELVEKIDLDTNIDFIFVGSLVLGKNPLYAIKLIEKLLKEERRVSLNLYGEGAEAEMLQNYTKEKNLEEFIFFHGNQNKQILKEAYKKAHFVILPSKSEGWPKAIAEGMFWGCVPITTGVSCIPFMLDYGNRGIILKMDLEKDTNRILYILDNENVFSSKSKLARDWSQNYTVDLFEEEIKTVLQK